MKTRKTMWAALSLLLVAAFVLSACGTGVVQTVVVEKEVPVEVVKTEVVEKVVTEVVTEVVEVEKGAFTTPHPILGDKKVREAMYYCTDKLELIKSVYPLLSPEAQAKLPMWSMIPSTSWAYAGDENLTKHEFDPEKGKALLEEAGWTLAEGADFRTNAAGEELALKFTTTTATFRQTWAAVFQQQMANCGINIIRLHAPASWWFGDTTGLARRDFELGAFAWVGTADPDGLGLWECDQIPLPENNWAGQNDMGWCNEEATVANKNANNTLVKDERIKWFTILQQKYAEDVPAIPLFNRSETYATRADMQGFDPQAGEPYYTYNAGTWTAPGTDTLVLGLTQEPASLFNLVENAFVAQVVSNLIGHGYSWTSLNYDYQPVFLTQMHD